MIFLLEKTSYQLILVCSVLHFVILPQEKIALTRTNISFLLEFAIRKVELFSLVLWRFELPGVNYINSYISSYINTSGKLNSLPRSAMLREFPNQECRSFPDTVDRRKTKDSTNNCKVFRVSSKRSNDKIQFNRLVNSVLNLFIYFSRPAWMNFEMSWYIYSIF